MQSLKLHTKATLSGGTHDTGSYHHAALGPNAHSPHDDHRTSNTHRTSECLQVCVSKCAVLWSHTVWNLNRALPQHCCASLSAGSLTSPAASAYLCGKITTFSSQERVSPIKQDHRSHTSGRQPYTKEILINQLLMTIMLVMRTFHTYLANFNFFLIFYVYGCVYLCALCVCCV